MSKKIKTPSVPVGPGITLESLGEIVTLTIDLTGDLGMSASGKSRKVATTSGNTSILGGLKMGINVYDPVPGRGALTLAEIGTMPESPIGSNLTASVADGKLTLTFDAGQDLGPSASGKSQKVSSSGGNVTTAAGLKLGVNVYDPIPAPRA